MLYNISIYLCMYLTGNDIWGNVIVVVMMIIAHGLLRAEADDGRTEDFY
jgi:hypothetical protein